MKGRRQDTESCYSLSKNTKGRCSQMLKRTGRSLLTSITSFLVLCTLVGPTTSFAMEPRQCRDEVILEAGELVTTSKQLKTHLLDVKERYKATDREYKEARELHRRAVSEYAGWVTVVKLAIEAGNTKDLRKDERYKQKAKKAGEAAKAFVDYAEK